MDGRRPMPGPSATTGRRASSPSARGEERSVLEHAGPPFFSPVWFEDIVGLELDGGTDWDEVAELCTESYCHLAPKKLVARVRDAQRPDLA